MPAALYDDFISQLKSNCESKLERAIAVPFGEIVQAEAEQPNLPGTVDEYPNWRLPVADGDGRPMTLEQLLDAPGVARLATLLDEGVRGRAVGSAPPASRDEGRST